MSFCFPPLMPLCRARAMCVACDVRHVSRRRSDAGAASSRRSGAQCQALLPQSEGTPMPTQRFSAEERGRMLSLYLRPWVLHRKYASPHVPHIADLDICVSAWLLQEERLRKSRMSSKTCSVIGVGRNFATA